MPTGRPTKSDKSASAWTRAKQVKSRPLFRQKVQGVVLKDVANAAARQQSDNLDRMLGLDRRDVHAQDRAIDVQHIHGCYLR
jgi:hypothetical protein